MEQYGLTNERVTLSNFVLSSTTVDVFSQLNHYVGGSKFEYQDLSQHSTSPNNEVCALNVTSGWRQMYVIEDHRIEPAEVGAWRADRFVAATINQHQCVNYTETRE